MTGSARYVKADRSQLSWDMVDLDGLLPADHPARLVWAFTDSLDLSAFYDAIKAREGEPGRPPADPQVLVALWLYATLEGVGSARALERLVKRDVSFRWLAGGVPVNYHGLSDFRVQWSEQVDDLLKQSVTALVSEGLVELEEIAIDGTKIAAAVSARSYTRGGRLDRLEQEAADRIAALKQELHDDPNASARRRRAAQARAARETQEKVAKARAALERLHREREARQKSHPKEEQKKKPPAVSLSDVDARWMRFPDKATRPGYNVQTSAVPKLGLVLTMRTTDRRNDEGLAVPVMAEVQARYGCAPRRLLLDAGYATRGDVAALAAPEAGPVTVYMPAPPERPLNEASAGARHQRTYARKNEAPAVKSWRALMQTAQAQLIYGSRKLMELIHANYKNRGMGRLTVRGMEKTHGAVLWHGLANNFMVGQRLRAAARSA